MSKTVEPHECAATLHCNKCNQDKPASEFNPRLKTRCRQCQSKYLKAWRAANPKKRKAQRKREYANNRDKLIAYSKRYAEENREKVAERMAAWQTKNRSKLRDNARKRYQENREHREMRKSHNSARHKRLRQATPKWQDDICIRYVYRIAQRITEQTEVLHTVDHILPLNGKTVSGLNVVENLQILTAIENSKKNRKVEDMI